MMTGGRYRSVSLTTALVHTIDSKRSIVKRASLLPFRSAKFSSRTFSRISGLSAMIWKSHVQALLVASCDAKRNVKTVIEISKSEKSLNTIDGFSDSGTVSPFAILSLYFAESCIDLIQASMMQVTSPPAAILTLAFAAHFANSSKAISAAFLPYQLFVNGRMIGKLTSSSAAVIR